MKYLLLFLLLIPFTLAYVPPDAVCFELRNGTMCFVPNNETGRMTMMMMDGGPIDIYGDLTVKGDFITDVEADTGLKIGSGDPVEITYDGQDGYFADDVEIADTLAVKGLANFTDLTCDELNATENISTSQYFIGDGSLLTGMSVFDSNASTACVLGDYLDGGGTCEDINDTIDARTASITYLPTSNHTLYGTESGGNNLGNLSYYDNNAFSVQEDAGANAMEIYVNFSSVSSFDWITMRHFYDGGGGHEIVLEVWHYTNSLWEVYDTITDQANYSTESIAIFEPSDHISDGIVQTRFRHTDNGVPGHEFHIDFINLVDGTSTISLSEHDGLSGRDSIANHPWAMTAHAPFRNMTGNLSFFGSFIRMNTTQGPPNTLYSPSSRWSMDSAGNIYLSLDYNNDGSNKLLVSSGGPDGTGTLLTQTDESQGFLIGSDTPAIADGLFGMDGGDLYVHDDAGFNGVVFMDSNLNVDGTINIDATGTALTVDGDTSLGTGAGDHTTINGGNLLLDDDCGTIGGDGSLSFGESADFHMCYQSTNDFYMQASTTADMWITGVQNFYMQGSGKTLKYTYGTPQTLTASTKGGSIDMYMYGNSQIFSASQGYAMRCNGTIGGMSAVGTLGVGIAQWDIETRLNDVEVLTVIFDAVSNVEWNTSLEHIEFVPGDIITVYANEISGSVALGTTHVTVDYTYNYCDT